MRGRFAKFGLELHPGKTRLIEFGRFAARDRAGRGLGKPETFDFLGFTHICARSKSGRFWVKRITISKRMRAKLKAVKDQLRRRMHQPIPVQGRWLASVVRGHMAYYAVPGNAKAVTVFRDQVTRHWHKALRCRSQKTRINWTRTHRIATRRLPPARPRDASVPGGALRRHSPKVAASAWPGVTGLVWVLSSSAVRCRFFGSAEGSAAEQIWWKQ